MRRLFYRLKNALALIFSPIPFPAAAEDFTNVIRADRQTGGEAGSLSAETFNVTERTATKYVDDGRRERRRNVNGRRDRFALISETMRPRRDVYPAQPSGRDVVWLTRKETGKEPADENR